MSPSEIVTTFIRAIEKGDLDAAVALVSDDCEYDNVPLGKVFGPADIKTTLLPFLERADSVEWIVHRQAADGPIVFNERLDRFQFPFGWIEVPVTGVFEVHDGKITLWRDYFDEGSYRDQIPSP
jgi:limonene-1,2-epoxide hydrolase